VGATISQRLIEAAVVTSILIGLGIALHATGADIVLADRFFDTVSGRFTRRADPMLELLGHHLARSAVTSLWFVLASAAIASTCVRSLRPWRAILIASVCAMALGPLIVVVLKSFTAFPCPWSLQRYGGFATEPLTWFTAPAQAGHCFPSGHSAGGYSLFALVFAARACGRPRLAWWLLAISLAVGTAFSGVRIIQGAHFASHALWAAGIDWLAAALAFLPIRVIRIPDHFAQPRSDTRSEPS
jgi:membrane-associated PAP2 superfamily phosphatase